MFLLLYACSTYHYIFSWMAMNYSDTHLRRNFLFENIGQQEQRFQISSAPVYGFETFTIMTCFIIVDYWIRKRSYPQMSVRCFLNAFLFSQMAYVGYIYRLLQLTNERGFNAFDATVYEFVFYTPMLIISFPLSLYLFKIWMKRRTLECEGSNKSCKVIVDYLIFWCLAFIYAHISYH